MGPFCDREFNYYPAVFDLLTFHLSGAPTFLSAFTDG